jgi:Flp pilus assembly protein TadD
VRRRGRIAKTVFRTVALTTAAFALGSCGYLVILHDPLTAHEHNDLGVAYETQGQLDSARREYRRALKLEPGMSRARVNLGNVEAARGRWSAAEKLYRRALADSVTDADAMNNLAVALLRRGKPGEAQRMAEQAVAIGGERDSIYRATLEEIRAAKR